MIKTITVQEARKRSGLTIANIYGLCRSGRYNWGDAIDPEITGRKNWVYLIYEDLFMDWLRERS
jgi:hypothetical protein